MIVECCVILLYIYVYQCPLITDVRVQMEEIEIMLWLTLVGVASRFSYLWSA